MSGKGDKDTRSPNLGLRSRNAGLIYATTAEVEGAAHDMLADVRPMDKAKILTRADAYGTGTDDKARRSRAFRIIKEIDKYNADRGSDNT